MSTFWLPIVLLPILMLGACQLADNPEMRPGDDCLSCHRAGRNSDVWTVAGTVFSDPNADPNDGEQGAQVLVTDSVGKSLTLQTNGAGNFYTAESLTFPISVAVQQNGLRLAMSQQPATGACNSCHTVPGQNGALGRLFVPNYNPGNF